MPVIPGLPPELCSVPAGPASPDDPKRNAKRQSWKDWRDAVLAYRQERAFKCADDPHQQAIERHKCQHSAAYFIAVWGYLFEPRKRKRGSGYGGEFVPFARQVEMLDAIEHCLTIEDGGAKSDLAVSKSRDVGASWVAGAFAVKQWLFDRDIQIGIVSYKEELVESKKPDSIFWKIDYLLDHLPKWMLPRYNDVHLTMTNLDNGNVITGYTTTKNSARGGRATLIIYDEASFFEEFAATWTASVAAADTRIALSSMSVDHGPDFYRLAMDNLMPEDEQPTRLAIDWWDHPLHDDQWIENEKKRYGVRMEAFHREVLRNPFAGSDNFVYPEAQNVLQDSKYSYNPSYPQYTAIDPGKRDDCAIVYFQIDPEGRTHVIDGYSSSGKPADYYGTILTATPDYKRFQYDPEAERIMRTYKDRKVHMVYGDVAGWNEEAATMESVYSRLATNYKVIVFRDHTKDGEVTQAKRANRSFRGRREAMRELFPTLGFATTPGAGYVLTALKENRYRPGERAVSTEEGKPLHDDTSHYASACEYFAVNRRIQRSIRDNLLAKPERTERYVNYLKDRVYTRNMPRWEQVA